MASGTSGNDSMSGGSGNDTISGLAGNDTLSGLDGNDELYGGAGADSVYGGAGSDAASGGAGNDLLDGGSGGDNLVGGQGVDSFYGGTGNDTIIGDGQWMNTANMASGLLGFSTTLTVVNNADGPIKLFWLDTFGNSQFVATITAGQTYSLSTLTSNNYVLLDDQNYFLDAITGASNQTFTYAAPLGDLVYGGANDDLIVSQYGADSVYGDDGNDTVYGGYGQDVIFGGTGNDSLLGEADNDSVFGGSGNDTVNLGDGNDSFGDWSVDESGDDSIDGGKGNDSINGGSGNDAVYGGEGDDWLTGAQGNDTLYGGAGTDSFAITDDHQGDTIFGGESAGDNDIVTFANYVSTQGVTVTFSGTEAGSYTYQGGASGSFSEIEVVAGTNYGDTLNAATATGNVQLSGMAGDDSISGGAGNDTIYFGAGNDTVYGGAGRDLIDDVNQGVETGNNLIDASGGNDTVWAGGGNDTLQGGAGDDVLISEAGADALAGGVGADSLYGGDGDDSLQGGAGNDLLAGGAGNDRFGLAAAGGADVISDFDLALTGGGTADQLDVSELRNPDGSAVRVWDVRISDDGNGHAVLTFPEGESVVLNGVRPDVALQPGLLHAMGVPCFAAGTRILTPQGERAVEDLALGDLVMTAAGQALPVLWQGRRRVADLAAQPNLRPIRLAAGAFGNHRALTLSPQHAVCVAAAEPALIRARHLAAFSPQARLVQGLCAVEYHHFLLPRHALVFAEGALVESFYPGPLALAALLPPDLARLQAVLLAPVADLPWQSLCQLYGPRCLPLLSRRAAWSLLMPASPKPPRQGQDAIRRGESVSATTMG